MDEELDVINNDVSEEWESFEEPDVDDIEELIDENMAELEDVEDLEPVEDFEDFESACHDIEEITSDETLVDEPQMEISEDIPPLDEGTIADMKDDMDNITTYEQNGYTYEKNELGQIIYAGGDLRLAEGIRDNYAQRMAGGDDRHEKDDGGHLIGARFDGYGGEGNLIAQDYSVNRGGYKSLEDQWAHELEQDNKVHVDIEPIFHGDSLRPDIITGSYQVTSDEKSYKDYFSMTNENLRSEEFELPPEADEAIWANIMDTDYKEYEKELK